MSFYGGGTREGPEVWSRISRRNFWPGSKLRKGKPLVFTVGDMLWNRIPLREQRRSRPRLPIVRGKWAMRFDGPGDAAGRLSPRPEPHR